MKDSPLYKAALNVVQLWSKSSSIDQLDQAIEELKLAIMAENRLSWTDDYYDLDDKFINTNGDE